MRCDARYCPKQHGNELGTQARAAVMPTPLQDSAAMDEVKVIELEDNSIEMWRAMLRNAIVCSFRPPVKDLRIPIHAWIKEDYYSISIMQEGVPTIALRSTTSSSSSVGNEVESKGKQPIHSAQKQGNTQQQWNLVSKKRKHKLHQLVNGQICRPIGRFGEERLLAPMLRLLLAGRDSAAEDQIQKDTLHQRILPWVCAWDNFV
ncbi:hypothetical protein AMTR_s00010p00190610 [Amborella trichopoda]|uniref:Uncharacterized protein n=1 Tax=Amborella trichopoda TaxID=13333 RepID=W1NG85_AMBTC|nr:hypothetical protein AMTR_s00010p00190610 [Amborella trichopoda]